MCERLGAFLLLKCKGCRTPHKRLASLLFRSRARDRKSVWEVDGSCVCLYILLMVSHTFPQGIDPKPSVEAEHMRKQKQLARHCSSRSVSGRTRCRPYTGSRPGSTAEPRPVHAVETRSTRLVRRGSLVPIYGGSTTPLNGKDTWKPRLEVKRRLAFATSH